MGKYDIKKPQTDLMDYDITIYGDAGAGKTSFMNILYNNPFFFAFEKGQKAMAHRGVFVPDWLSFKREVAEIIREKQAGNLDFDVVIIDTCDLATVACKRYVCDNNGWEEPDGMDWLYVKTEYEAEIKKLLKAGFKIGRIAHAKVVTIKPLYSKEYDEIQPNIGATFKSDVIEIPDFLIYFRYKKITEPDGETKVIREMVLESDCTCKAKGRSNMPKVIDCGKNPQEAVDNFKKAFKESFLKDEIEETKTVTKKKAPKQETKKKTEVEGVEAEQEATTNNDNLKNLLGEITRLGKELLLSNKITSNEIKEVNQALNGLDKVSEITTENQALKLLEELKKI